MIDDAYGDAGCEDGYAARAQWSSFISNAGMILLEEKLAKEDKIKATNDESSASLQKGPAS